MANIEQLTQNKNTRKRKRNVIDAGKGNNAQQQPDLQPKRQERILIPRMVKEVRIVLDRLSDSDLEKHGLKLTKRKVDEKQPKKCTKKRNRVDENNTQKSDEHESQTTKRIVDKKQPKKCTKKRNRIDENNTQKSDENESQTNKDVMPNLEQDPTQFIQNKNTRKRKRNVIDAEVNNAQQQPDLQQKRQERIKIPQMVNELTKSIVNKQQSKKCSKKPNQIDDNDTQNSDENETQTTVQKYTLRNRVVSNIAGTQSKDDKRLRKKTIDDNVHSVASSQHKEKGKHRSKSSKILLQELLLIEAPTRQFLVAEVVLATVPGFCPWPSIILSITGQTILIEFFGTGQRNLVRPNSICHFNINTVLPLLNRKGYRKAIKELEMTLEIPSSISVLL